MNLAVNAKFQARKTFKIWKKLATVANKLKQICPKD